MNRHPGLTAASLVAVAILGVAGAAWFAQTSADRGLAPGTAAQEASPSPSPTPTGATTEDDEPAPSLEDFRVTTYEVFLSRDPFEPVVVSVVDPENPPEDASPTTNPTTSPTTSPTTNPTTSPTTSPTTNPTTSPTTNPTTSPTPGDCVDNGAVVCDGQNVSVVDVFNDGTPGVVVRVDQTIYEVRAGETFAGSFQVISVEPPCATLLFGDDAFTLCEGESTLK